MWNLFICEPFCVKFVLELEKILHFWEHLNSDLDSFCLVHLIQVFFLVSTEF